ncbi:uncharacterized protein LOC123536849 [Mercenaria mercenaria]|uniref:uncharacterized protein LOC123536849 n=1 Tax=Mercenaria mercenaria TaxID=6596 RepID=UPI00234E5DEC|nr:uncharacterized protein LOC123536849 [Mercenaria mercenaria]
MASGKSDKIRNEQEDGDFEDETLSSDYLIISGSTSSTIRSDVTISRSYLSIRGSEITGTDTPSFLSVSDPETSYDDVSTMFDELQHEDDLADEDISKDRPYQSGKKLCSNCVVDGKQTEATHLCKGCRPDGRYICHKCLQSHNRWSLDHFVISLSVEEESSVRSRKENNEDSNELITSEEHIMNYLDEVLEFQENATNDTRKTETKTGKITNAVEQESDRSGTLHHPKIRRFRGGVYDNDKAVQIAEKRDRPRFYDDKLYREIIQDQRYKYHLQATGKNFTKYGTYSVRTDTDTKPCFVTGTCQLPDGRLVMTDSENCRLKILDPNIFEVTASRKLQSNPCLICYMTENKVAIAFTNCDVAIIDILEDIEVRGSFRIKHLCKGLSYGNGNLYVCSTHMIEIYSEKGDRKTLLQLASTDVEIRCPASINLSKNGSIIYVSDIEKGIIAMDVEGHILNIISDNVYEPNVLCLDVSGNIFATEMNSGRVLNVDPDNGSVKQVVREVCQKDYPISLCHERVFNRLIVGVWRSDNIHVFSCP